MSRYAILRGKKVIVLPEFVGSTADLGVYILKLQMRKEGNRFNDEGRVEYLKDWAETITENSGEHTEFDQVVEVAADTLVYSTYHLIDYDLKESLSSEHKSQVYNAIIEKLYSSIL